MSSNSCETCNEAASYHSEKCRECGFLFLQLSTKKAYEALSKRPRSARALCIIGSGVVGAGFVAAIADFPTVALGLIIFGVGTLLADIFSH